MLHVSKHWTLATLRRELKATEDFIRARQTGSAGRQIGLKAALERAEKIRAIIRSREQNT